MAEYSMINCLRTDKPMKRNGKYPIYLRIRVKDKETKVPTGLDVLKERWDDKPSHFLWPHLQQYYPVRLPQTRHTV